MLWTSAKKSLSSSHFFLRRSLSPASLNSRDKCRIKKFLSRALIFLNKKSVSYAIEKLREHEKTRSILCQYLKYFFFVSAAQLVSTSEYDNALQLHHEGIRESFELIIH